MPNLFTPEEEEKFLSQEDDNEPVTRGEVRRLAAAFRQDLKWFALVTVVANQTLSHVQIPSVAGYTGIVVGAVAGLGLGIAKLWFVR